MHPQFRRAILATLAATLAAGYGALGAPVTPKSDAALRARADQFLNLIVGKKYRQAEALIADDTKDFYYAIPKPDLTSFRITDVQYAPDGRSARVTANTKRTILMPGAPIAPIEMPLVTTWKLERGAWMLYIDQTARTNMPMGQIRPGPATSSSTAMPDVPSPEQLARLSQTAGLTVEPTEITLDPANSGPTAITITNRLPAPISVELFNPIAGLAVELPAGNVAPDQKAQVRVAPTPNTTERPTQLLLRVQPMGQTLVIGLKWAH